MSESPKPLCVLIEEANAAWREWRRDYERQRADREALERLQPALAELSERFRWPRKDDQPSVHEDPVARSKAEYLIFRVFAAGGQWSPPES